jgi:hypothetical protein
VTGRAEGFGQHSACAACAACLVRQLNITGRERGGAKVHTRTLLVSQEPKPTAVAGGCCSCARSFTCPHEHAAAAINSARRVSLCLRPFNRLQPQHVPAPSLCEPSSCLYIHKTFLHDSKPQLKSIYIYIYIYIHISTKERENSLTACFQTTRSHGFASMWRHCRLQTSRFCFHFSRGLGPFLVQLKA